MSNLTFENVKAGDKLMIEGRSFGYSLECLTHWMPLPEPPSDD